MLVFQTVQKEGQAIQEGWLKSLVESGVNQQKAEQLLKSLPSFGFSTKGANHVVKYLVENGVPPDLFSKLDSLKNMQDISDGVRKEAALMLLKKSGTGNSIAVGLAMKLANLTTIGVYNFDTKTVDVRPIDAVADMIPSTLSTYFKDKSVLEVLRSTLSSGVSDDDGKLLKYLQNQVPGITSADLKELGNVDFSSFTSKLLAPDLLKIMVTGAIRSQNSIDNTGSDVYSIGMQDITYTIAPNLIGIGLAALSARKEPMKKESAFTSGSVKFKVGSESNPDVLCYRLENSIFGGACLSLNLNEQYYMGATSPEKAIQNIMMQPNTSNEMRATQLFGQEFVDKVKDIVRSSVASFLASGGVGDIDALSAIISNQLQTLATIEDMRANSAFTYDISKKKQDEKARQDEEISGRGGFT